VVRRVAERFAGANPDIAVVEPDARAVLSSFDETVRHFDVILRTPTMDAPE
jgi:hypothetical protein